MSPTSASLASAATHVWQAYQVAGLSPEAFANWLRRIAKDVETDGERAGTDR